MDTPVLCPMIAYLLAKFVIEVEGTKTECVRLTRRATVALRQCSKEGKPFGNRRGKSFLATDVA